MPFRRIANKTKNAIAPVNPDSKCRKRQRVAVAVVPAVYDDDCLLDADECDWDSSDLFDDVQEYEELAKRHCSRTNEPSEEQLLSEVATLKESVKSMEKNVAKAAEKISELRDLVALYLEQREQVTSPPTEQSPHAL